MNPLSTIAIIVVWMGKLPSYFPLWMRSLEYNPTINFCLITDQEILSLQFPVEKPDNLAIVRLSFDDLKKQIKERLHLSVSSINAYKLVDFKPTYGELFADLLRGFDFWGNCDIDMLFGNIRQFVTEDILQAYKKIFNRGHFTLYRNESEINDIYRTSALFPIQKILESKDVYGFDEWHGIHAIFEEAGLAQYNKEVMVDIKYLSSNIVGTNIHNYLRQIFVWEYGKVTQYYLEGEQIRTIELAYMHFQKRQIQIRDTNVYLSPVILLLSRALVPFDWPITPDIIRQYDQTDHLHYFNAQIKRIQKRLTPPTLRNYTFNKHLNSLRLR